MAKKKTFTEQLAADAIAILKDAIRDIEILGAGRFNWERKHCIVSNLFKVHDLLAMFDPEKRKAQIAAKDTPPPRQLTNGHVIPEARRLTHVIDTRLF